MAYTNGVKYRRLDDDGDMLFGHGEQDFIRDLDAMRQAIQTRLKVIRGEWWEGDATAIPYFGILGSKSYGKADIDLVIINRIMDTYGVIEVSETISELKDRRYTFSCKVGTVYGETYLSIGTENSADIQVQFS